LQIFIELEEIDIRFLRIHMNVRIAQKQELVDPEKKIKINLTYHTIISLDSDQTFTLTGSVFMHCFPTGARQKNKYLEINLEFSKGV